MCAFSNEVMGETLDAWMHELLNVFEAHTDDIPKLEPRLEECDLLSITIVNLSNGGDIDFDRFKPVMLAALRSLLPKTWSMEHETAWQWLWKTIATNLMEATMKVRSYKPWSTKLYGAITDEQRESFRSDIYIDFFAKCKQSQELFKQSQTRLRYIADRIMLSAYDMLHKPVQEMVDELSALGLRHVGYGVPVSLFAPFTDTIVLTMKPIVASLADEVTIVTEARLLRVNRTGWRPEESVDERPSFSVWGLDLPVEDGEICPAEEEREVSDGSLFSFLFYAARSNTHWLEDFNVPDKMMLDGFRWSLGLVARILMRTITEGSTSVMQAINYDDQRQITKALNDAPRFDRVRWQLRVRVGTQTISPLHYALRSGSHRSAKKMIQDVLTIRADRQRYYYGVDELFNYQPDCAEHVCSEAPFLAMEMLEGLVWRSHKSHDGMRSVIYYLEHLLQDTEEDSTLSRSMKTFISFKNAKIIQHPIIVFTTDLLWSRLVLRVFLCDRAWTAVTFVFYIFSQCVLNQPHFLEKQVLRYVLFATRLLVYICGLGRLLYWHCRETFRASRRKDMVKFRCLSFPAYWKEFEHRISLGLLFVLVGMLFVEPMMYCLNADDVVEFKCDAHSDGMHMVYQCFSALGVFLFCSMILDLAALNIRMAAYKVLCAQAMDEVLMCGIALLVTIVTFTFVISSLSRETQSIQTQDWKSMDGAMLALTQTAFGLFSMESMSELAQESGLIFACILLYSIAVYTCLFNLLVSQFCGIYMALAEDIEGHARLVRGQIILTVLKDLSLKKWQAFMGPLHLDEKTDFAEGDTGLPGGIKIQEPAYLHPVAHDQILRYGGKTDPSLPWPEKDTNADESVEAMVERTIMRSVAKAFGQNSSSENHNNTNGSHVGTSSVGHSEGGLGSHLGMESGFLERIDAHVAGQRLAGRHEWMLLASCFCEQALMLGTALLDPASMEVLLEHPRRATIPEDARTEAANVNQTTAEKIHLKVDFKQEPGDPRSSREVKKAEGAHSQILRRPWEKLRVPGYLWRQTCLNASQAVLMSRHKEVLTVDGQGVKSLSSHRAQVCNWSKPKNAYTVLLTRLSCFHSMSEPQGTSTPVDVVEEVEASEMEEASATDEVPEDESLASEISPLGGNTANAANTNNDSTLALGIFGLGAGKRGNRKALLLEKRHACSEQDVKEMEASWRKAFRRDGNSCERDVKGRHAMRRMHVHDASRHSKVAAYECPLLLMPFGCPGILGEKFGKTMEELFVWAKEELSMAEHEKAAIRHSWNAFQKASALGDSEAVGDAIYGCLTGALSTEKDKFKTPRAVLCLALFNGFRQLSDKLDNPPALFTFVEILGFKHLTFGVTMAQTTAVSDSFIEILQQQVQGQELVPGAIQAWRNLLFYVGSCLRYISVTYSRRLELIGEDWKAIQEASNANEEEAAVRSFPKMCAFSNEVMGEVLDAWMHELLNVFEALPPWLEECDLLSITIVNLSNGGDIDFDRFKPVMLAALRSLLPKTWSMEHETAWQWLWKTIATNLMEATMKVRSYKPWSTKLYSVITDEQRESFRSDIYTDFFSKCAMSQELFKQSQTRLRYIADRIMLSAYDMLHKPVQEMVDELSALGLRHVGYGVPVELMSSVFAQKDERFAPFTDTIVLTMKPIVASLADDVTTVTEAGVEAREGNAPWVFFQRISIRPRDPTLTGWRTGRELRQDFNVPDKMMLDGFRWSLGLVARILMRTITEGSTSVMQAINHDDHRQIVKALNDSPRFDRVRWQLRVRVGTQTISPLHYALRSGSHQSARKMIEDVLTIRADRQRYYYGVDELFNYQPDVAEHVCSEAPFLAMELLEGLVWRSHKSHEGMRAVIYYLEHLLQDTEEDSTLSRSLKTFISFKDAKIIQRPGASQGQSGFQAPLGIASTPSLRGSVGEGLGKLEQRGKETRSCSACSRRLFARAFAVGLRVLSNLSPDLRHPIIVFTTDLLWSRLVVKVFLCDRAWTGFTFVIYILSQCSLNQPHFLENAVLRYVLGTARLLVYICGLGRLLYWHCRETCRASRRKDMVRFGRLSIPAYWGEFEHRISLALLVVLVGMLLFRICAFGRLPFFVQPMIYCLNTNDVVEFTCSGYTDAMHMIYQSFSALGVFLFCSMILDLAALNIRMAAYKVLCAQAMDQARCALDAI
ncbi:unnamed protein product [Symbiodinium natans]|uniref:Uncharacterized protein n=1 Tax=Symbiodinium natans TaxID=878477 RepID=A0A812SZW9_9DINO|nr:unnamed protein product [Symbiodinium natans]